MVAGGAEAALLPITVAAFDMMGALSQRVDDPKGACRPFDNDRDGFVMSEGAAIGGHGVRRACPRPWGADLR